MSEISSKRLLVGAGAAVVVVLLVLLWADRPTASRGASGEGAEADAPAAEPRAEPRSEPRAASAQPSPSAVQSGSAQPDDMARGEGQVDAPEKGEAQTSAPEIASTVAQPVEGQPVPAQPAKAEPALEQPAKAQPVEPALDPASGQFDHLHVDAEGGVTLAGRAPADAQVEILVDGEVVSKTGADARGAFAVQFDVAPSQSPRSIAMRIVEEGAAPVMGAQVLQIAPFAEPSDPLAETATIASRDAPSAADTPETPSPSPILTDAQSGRVLGPALDRLAIDTLSYDGAGNVVVSGRGLAEGAQLLVYLDNKPVALSAPARKDRSGWQLDLPEIAPGTYSLRVDAVGADGAVLARAQTPFLRETPESLAKAVAESGGAADAAKILTVQPGNTLWAIARETYGDGLLYVRVFEANRDQIRNPDLIYPGQVFNLPR